MKKVFIHHTALVDTDDIGDESRIWAYTHIMSGASIGKNCHIGDHCFIESGVTVGRNTVIKNGNMLWEGITIEEGVFVGPHVFFTNDQYPRSRYLPQANNRYLNKRNWLVPTLVKRGGFTRSWSHHPCRGHHRRVLNGRSGGRGYQRCSTICSGKGQPC